MRALTLALLGPAALGLCGPALAEPLSEVGYFLGCDMESQPAQCVVNASGANFLITEGSGTPPEVFAGFKDMVAVTAVHLEGSFEFVGDVTVEAVLTAMTPAPDDLYEGNLRAMQGRWSPAGDDSAFIMEINGLDWIELSSDQVTDSYMMMPGAECASGIAPGGGMAITLYRYGDDPEDDGCWLLEFVDDISLTLRDFKGDKGQMDFTRMDY